MVKIGGRAREQASRLRNSPHAAAYYALIGGVVLFVLVLLSSGGDGGATDIARLADLNTNSIRSTTSTTDDHQNTAHMKAWRKEIRTACSEATTEAQVLAIANRNKQGFAHAAQPVAQPRDPVTSVKRCRSVVMDFGANIGDTSGHVIDSGMIGCDKTKELSSAKAKTPFVHFNTVSKQFEDVKKVNQLTHQLVKMMATFGALTGPEDYCYYGVEGNPVFTTRLQELEDTVMSMTPRPIQHMHFFTESVGSGTDGMTKLYLDTINAKENFWGSSIFANHQDVRKSAAQANTTADTIAAPVMGYTIGTLMRKTLAAFDPALSTEQEKKGNHLVLKVDIEGGEYPLLHQAVEEGTLCEFVKMGNQADLFIEFHSQRVTGKHEYAGKTKDMKEKLTACGVNFRNLAAWWG